MWNQRLSVNEWFWKLMEILHVYVLENYSEKALKLNVYEL